MADYIFQQENQVVKSFLDNTDYSNDQNYTATNVSQYIDGNQHDDPSVLTLTVPSGATKIVIEDEWEEEISGNTYDVSNLVPFKSHIYSFQNGSGTVLESGTIVPNGKNRMIYLNGAHNCRDMGGWKCAGGNIKYGLLYRSGELQSNYGITVSGNDVWRLREQCGILCELDFRGTTETDGGTPSDPSDDYTESVLGSDIEYINIPINQYDIAVTTQTAPIINVLRTLFANVKNNKPTIFHCQAGADRTGTIAFIIGALLGMSQSDLDKDYELTSLSGVYGTQTRTRLNQNYLLLINYIKSLSGDTYEEKVIGWAMDHGITGQEINEFRSNMIDGTVPDFPHDYSVTYKLKNVNSTNTSIFVNHGDVYLSKIAPTSSVYKIRKVEIEMNGVDITDDVWLGTEIFEDKVLITEQYLTDIADAIRSKLSSSSTYKPSQMASAISAISGGGVMYSITKDLMEGVTVDNSLTSISANASYIANVTASSAIAVTITMGGVDVSNYYRDGVITIPRVTGNIVITVTAEQYPNLIPSSKDASGNAYNTTGYKTGYRLNSSGAEVAFTASPSFVTGFMPFALGQTIMYDKFTGSESSNGSICFYDTNHTKIAAYTVARMKTDGILTNGQPLTFTPDQMIHDSSGTEKDITAAAYIRISSFGDTPSEAICNIY